MALPVAYTNPGKFALHGSRAARCGRTLLETPHSMRAGALAASAASCARWVLPWASVLVLSGTIAYAADQALAHSVVELPASNGSPTEPVPRAPADAGFRWVVLLSTDIEGAQRSLTCLAPADRVSGDVLKLAPEDLDPVARGLCTWALIDPWPGT